MRSGENPFCCIMETLEKEFNRELLAARQNRAVDWGFAKNALRRLANPSGTSHVCLLEFEQETPRSSWQCANSTDTRTEFWQIFEFLMRSFDILNLRDTALAADLQCHAFYFVGTCEMDFGSSPFDLDFDSHKVYDGIWYHRIRCQAGMLTQEQFRQLLKIPYSIPRHVAGARTNQIHKHVVWDAIKEENDKLVYAFLKYGVMFLPATEWIHHRQILAQLLSFTKNYQAPLEYYWMHIQRGFEISVIHRACIIMRILELLVLELKKRQERPQPDEPPRKKRPGLARHAEHSSSCKSVYFRCVGKVFESIPEPFVSSAEVRKLLRRSYDRFWDESLELSVNEIIADLEELYPEAAEPPAPRSLKHLSRCQVRENLRQSGNLPHGIKDLKPNRIQKYIALEL